MNLIKSKTFSSITTPKEVLVFKTNNICNYIIKSGDRFYNENGRIIKKDGNFYYEEGLVDTCISDENIVEVLSYEKDLPSEVVNSKSFLKSILFAYKDIAKEVAKTIDEETLKLSANRCLDFIKNFNEPEDTLWSVEMSAERIKEILREGFTCYEIFIKFIYDNYEDYIKPFESLFLHINRDGFVRLNCNGLPLLYRDDNEFDSYRVAYDLIKKRIVIQTPNYNSLATYDYVNNSSCVPIGLVSPKVLWDIFYNDPYVLVDFESVTQSIKEYFSYVAKVTENLRYILGNKLRYLTYLDLEKNIEKDCKIEKFKLSCLIVIRDRLKRISSTHDYLCKDIVNFANILLNGAVYILRNFDCDELSDDEEKEINYLLNLVEMFI